MARTLAAGIALGAVLGGGLVFAAMSLGAGNPWLPVGGDPPLAACEEFDRAGDEAEAGLFADADSFDARMQGLYEASIGTAVEDEARELLGSLRDVSSPSPTMAEEHRRRDAVRAFTDACAAADVS